MKLFSRKHPTRNGCDPGNGYEKISQNPTQKELAERTGINQAEISKLENGTRNLDADSVKFDHCFAARSLTIKKQNKSLEIGRDVMM